MPLRPARGRPAEAPHLARRRNARSTTVMHAVPQKASPEVTSVTGTAFVVAEYRAEENDAVEPLYRDEVVGIFLSAASRRAAARVAGGFPEVRELVKIRTRYYDDMLERQIAAGCRQVVVLGAGLDTRAVRKAAPGVRFFEIDDRATMALKRHCLSQHHLADVAAFIDGNYVTDGMLPLLLANGLDVDAPTFVIWEGNTMYLDAATDLAILRQLAAGLSQVRVSFDYFVPEVITRTTGNAGMTHMADAFTAMGAPWLTGFADVRELGSDAGLMLLENVTTAVLGHIYRPRAEAPSFGPFYAIATLGSF
jgi:methyltransferase (TIGR00027 family)